MAVAELSLNDVFNDPSQFLSINIHRPTVYRKTASHFLLRFFSDMSQTVVLKVAMTCQGCVGAVQRVLGKMEGVESYDINLEEQKVTVKGKVEPDAVLKTVSKTGKATAFWET